LLDGAMCPVRFYARPQLLKPGETVSGPYHCSIIVLRECGRGSRQYHPRLFAGGEDVYIRWQCIRVVKRADSHEFGYESGAAVVTPHRDLATRAAGDLLPSSTQRRGIHQLRIRTLGKDPLRFDHRIKGKRRPGFTLAPSTVAAMNYQGCRCHAVSNGAAVAATVDGKVNCVLHEVQRRLTAPFSGRPRAHQHAGAHNLLGRARPSTLSNPDLCNGLLGGTFPMPGSVAQWLSLTSPRRV
jgi:hypothetical protein